MAVYGLATQVAGPYHKAVVGSYPPKVGVYVFQTNMTDVNTRLSLLGNSWVDPWYSAHFTVYLDGSVEQHYETDVKLVSDPEKGGEQYLWIGLSGSWDNDPSREQWDALVALLRWVCTAVMPNIVIQHKVNLRGNIQAAE